jgi:hypothetical protein
MSVRPSAIIVSASLMIAATHAVALAAAQPIERPRMPEGLSEDVVVRIDDVIGRKAVRDVISEHVAAIASGIVEDDVTMAERFFPDLTSGGRLILAQAATGVDRDSTLGGFAPDTSPSNTVVGSFCYQNCHGACHSACHGSRGWR